MPFPRYCGSLHGAAEGLQGVKALWDMVCGGLTRGGRSTSTNIHKLYHLLSCSPWTTNDLNSFIQLKLLEIEMYRFKLNLT